jgi:hypothetical protein
MCGTILVFATSFSCPNLGRYEWGNIKDGGMSEWIVLCVFVV